MRSGELVDGLCKLHVAQICVRITCMTYPETVGSMFWPNGVSSLPMHVQVMSALHMAR